MRVLPFEREAKRRARTYQAKDRGRRMADIGIDFIEVPYDPILDKIMKACEQDRDFTIKMRALANRNALAVHYSIPYFRKAKSFHVFYAFAFSTRGERRTCRMLRIRIMLRDGEGWGRTKKA